MAEIIEVAASNATPKKAGKAAKPKKAKVAPSHPKVSEMVTSAIVSLKERGGSSLQAIKKYIAAQYKVDIEKLSSHIKKYLKSAVLSGSLQQTKGKGATGSFRLPTSGGGASKDKSAAKAKPKKTAAKKAKTPKKAKASPKKAASKPKASPKKKVAALKKKSPTKKAARPKVSPKKVAKKPKAAKPKPKSPAKRASPKKGKK